MKKKKDRKISIIGLGYVGLPVAVAFGEIAPVIGFDISEKRIAELKDGHDSSFEVEPDDLKKIEIIYTSNPKDLCQADFHIISVPTPINKAKQPDLTSLFSATETIGSILKKGDIIVYESTVYPGCTEEDCVPILERESGLKVNVDFGVGYSPERINPGDKEHTFKKIKKIVAGSTTEIASIVAEAYKSVIKAGVYEASSIKVAEAAKVIENTQRDVNIALINELAMIFNRLNIDTEEVLKAAGTKWNFLSFRAGLVGGHCIGVDPYYLTHKASKVDYHPEIILAGRRINDSMGRYVVEQVSKLMTKKRIHVVDSSILIMGLTFKENCHDLRNTRVVDMIEEFKGYNSKVDVYDPWVDKLEAQDEYGIIPIESLHRNTYDAIILAVSHNEFQKMGSEQIRKLGKANHILYDLKYIFPKEKVDGRL